MSTSKTVAKESWFSLLNLSWVTEYVNKKHTMKKEDFDPIKLIDLDPDFKTQRIYEELQKEWQKCKGTKFSIFKALFLANKKKLLLAYGVNMINFALDFSFPFILSLFFDYAAQEERDLMTPVTLTLALCFSEVISVYVEKHSDILFVGLKAMIYQKSLRFSLLRNKEHTFGSIFTNLTDDPEEIYYAARYILSTIRKVSSCILGIIFLYNYIGVSIFAAIIVISISMFVNYRVAVNFEKLQTIYRGVLDRRIKFTEEVFSGIRYVKMSGWESKFFDRIKSIRNEEISAEEKQCHYDNLMMLIADWGGTLTHFITFVTYILTSTSLTSKSIFILISSLSRVKESLQSLPELYRNLSKHFFSMKKIAEFLISEEIDCSFIKQNPDPSTRIAIKMKNGNFHWAGKKENEDQEAKHSEEDNEEKQGLKGKDSQENKEICFRMNGLEFEIEKKSFVVIIGDIGSGKSSFLNSLLGEMAYDPNSPPELEINGSIAYVGDKSWVLNASARENIILGSEFDEKKYQESVQFSCLTRDFEIFINGDQTEIGERGVSLSGGQKARLNLARALYYDRDIYLMDDPLSAVDAHVGKFILEKTFLEHLKNKTRILVTHKVDVAQYADQLFVLKEGSIIEKYNKDEIALKIVGDSLLKFAKSISVEKKQQEVKEEFSSEDIKKPLEKTPEDAQI